MKEDKLWYYTDFKPGGGEWAMNMEDWRRKTGRRLGNPTRVSHKGIEPPTGFVKSGYLAFDPVRRVKYNPSRQIDTKLVTHFSKLETGDHFFYVGGYEPGYRQWRPEAEYEKLTPISAMTVHNHRIYQFPGDVVVQLFYGDEGTNPATIRKLPGGGYRVRTVGAGLPGRIKSYRTTLQKAQAQARILGAAENPHAETEELPESALAAAPPLYKLNYLIIQDEEKSAPPKRLTPAFPVQILPSEDSTVVFRFWGSGKYDVHLAFPSLGRFNIYDYCVQAINYQIVYDRQAHHLVHKFGRAEPYLGLDGLHGTRVLMKSYKQLDDFPKLPADWCYFQFIN